MIRRILPPPTALEWPSPLSKQLRSFNDCDDKRTTASDDDARQRSESSLNRLKRTQNRDTDTYNSRRRPDESATMDATQQQAQQQPPGSLSWRLSSHPITLLTFLGFRICASPADSLDLPVSMVLGPGP